MAGESESSGKRLRKAGANPRRLNCSAGVFFRVIDKRFGR